MSEWQTNWTGLLHHCENAVQKDATLLTKQEILQSVANSSNNIFIKINYNHYHDIRAW